MAISGGVAEGAPVSVAGQLRQGRGAVTAQFGGPLLLGALSVALLTQGAYYPRAQLYAGALVTAALFVVPDLTRTSGRDRVLVYAISGLAGWAVIDAVIHGDPRPAVPYLVLLIGVAAVLIMCGLVDDAARGLLVFGLIGCGVLIAALGWLGLALHLSRWTWQGQGLWRISSTLTYPNATAAVLAMLALVSVALLTETPRSVPLLLATTVLLTGLVGTLSRAGLLALSLGGLVLCAVAGWRVVVRIAACPVAGAAVAAIGLVPAMTASTPQPAAAVLALGAGLAVSVTAAVIRPAGVAVGGVVLLMLVLGGIVVRGAIGTISGARLTVADPERSASFQAAVEVFKHHPVLGAGPSLPSLTLRSQAGSSVYRYAHNEYLQVLAELGLIGGLLLIGLLALLLRRLLRALRNGGALAAGALAATTALTVHAGFDFVWHIPAIPLLAAALIGLASPEGSASGLTKRAVEISGKESA